MKRQRSVEVGVIINCEAKNQVANITIFFDRSDYRVIPDCKKADVDESIDKFEIMSGNNNKAKMILQDRIVMLGIKGSVCKAESVAVKYIDDETVATSIDLGIWI